MSDVFGTPISTSAPLGEFHRANHPVGLPQNTDNNKRPVPTNKFYGNMLLGDQTSPVWTHPYSLWVSKESNYGMAVSYIKGSSRVFDTQNNPPRFFFGPARIKSFVFSCTDFNSKNDVNIYARNLRDLSAQVRLGKNKDQFIQFDLVQGMGFVTAVYYNVIPKLYSAVGIRSVRGLGSPRSGISKYEVILFDNSTWTLYVSLPSGSLQLALKDGAIICDRSVYGAIFQLVADNQSAIDDAAGCYPTSATLSGSVSGDNGTYTIKYKTSGSSNSGNTLLYALPHHRDGFTSNTKGKTNSTLDSVVYGSMVGYVTNVFDIRVTVPSKLGFDPFTTIPGKGDPRFDQDTLNSIRNAARDEVNGNVEQESNLDSMYYSGKILAKYAWILYVCQFILNDSGLVSTLMPKLKNAMDRFIKNRQLLPLYYDTTWGGIVSTGTADQDFGNPYYNDHHFHYGYHVIAGALLAAVDKKAGDGNWLSQNREWVENLIRDYANPSDKDPYFPIFRSFDWFGGHSWAKGVFESADGKDQESSSEDVNAAYALKLWGKVTGNNNLSQIGDLMLGVLNTSVNHYFLYADDNKTEPPQFIRNKVSGIFFENKIDYATYFGLNTEYIHMIHAIPITPASSFVRNSKFVRQEWDQKLSGIVGGINDGWKGILMLNLALTDPRASWDFFNSSNFSKQNLDNGQSKTWSLTYSGAFK